MLQLEKLKKNGLKAVVLDLDGVITQTAKLHKKAWKKMFDQFLADEMDESMTFTEKDYISYVDGKPRYEGVKSFLESKDINLSYGSPDDSPENKTICGLGNKKNNYFLKILKNEGVEIYDDTIQKLKKWRTHHIKTAVVSSSKNCKQVLETAGISELFDVRVDGLVSEKRKLNGKPKPDIFIEAAKMLDTCPESCIVFEDAISGVQAGTRGNFALVVGVKRKGDKISLLHNGADIVIRNFNEFDIDKPELIGYFEHSIPFILSEHAQLEKIISNKKPVLFLDYDGTLTPIVNHPEDAILSEKMKNALQQCASKYNVAIISGRDMDDVKKMIQLEQLIYAGSHGFRISGPNGLYKEHEKTQEIVPKLDEIEKKLHQSFKDIQNINIERKRYAIAVHYRNIAKENIEEVLQKTDKIIKQHKGLKKGEGKKIIEIKPDIEWHKGKAINWILKKLETLKNSNVIPVYIGDDITDEDAFNQIKENGIGILVGFHGKKTAAKYKLKNVYQVRLFLQKLAGL